MSSPSIARHIVDRHAGDRRGDAAGEIGRVELGDRARAAAAAADAVPEALAADAERRDDADAGDDDARRGRDHLRTISQGEKSPYPFFTVR